MKLVRDDTLSGHSPMELPGCGCTADNSASRGATPLTKKGRRYVQVTCGCGQPAVARSSNSMACQRCADLTSKGEVRQREGIRAEAIPELEWQAISAACVAFFRRKGMTIYGGLGRVVK
jgi:hypothetical protein